MCLYIYTLGDRFYFPAPYLVMSKAQSYHQISVVLFWVKAPPSQLPKMWAVTIDENGSFVLPGSVVFP